MPLPGPWGALVLKTSHSQDKTLADIPQRLLSLTYGPVSILLTCASAYGRTAKAVH